MVPAFNANFPDRVVAVAANPEITFKPCQRSLPVQNALQDGLWALEVDLPDFLRLLSGMVQVMDSHVASQTIAPRCPNYTSAS
jgi:hypothetical protein